MKVSWMKLSSVLDEMVLDESVFGWVFFCNLDGSVPNQLNVTRPPIRIGSVANDSLSLLSRLLLGVRPATPSLLPRSLPRVSDNTRHCVHRVGSGSWAYDMRTKGNSDRAAGIECNLPNIADRNTWSHAPTPSAVRIVMFGLAAWACGPHSQFLWWRGRIEKGRILLWTPSWIASPMCGQQGDARWPLTPPFGFNSAVSRAPISASLISAGTLPCASKLDAATKNSVALSSSKSFRCSCVHPPGPADGPRGIQLHRTFRFQSRTSGSSSRVGSKVACFATRATSLQTPEPHMPPSNTDGLAKLPQVALSDMQPELSVLVASLGALNSLFRIVSLVPFPTQPWPNGLRSNQNGNKQLPSANLLHWITALGSFVDCFQRGCGATRYFAFIERDNSATPWISSGISPECRPNNSIASLPLLVHGLLYQMDVEWLKGGPPYVPDDNCVRNSFLNVRQESLAIFATLCARWSHPSWWRRLSEAHSAQPIPCIDHSSQECFPHDIIPLVISNMCSAPEVSSRTRQLSPSVRMSWRSAWRSSNHALNSAGTNRMSGTGPRPCPDRHVRFTTGPQDASWTGPCPICACNWLTRSLNVITSDTESSGDGNTTWGGHGVWLETLQPGSSFFQSSNLLSSLCVQIGHTLLGPSDELWRQFLCLHQGRSQPVHLFMQEWDMRRNCNDDTWMVGRDAEVQQYCPLLVIFEDEAEYVRRLLETPNKRNRFSGTSQQVVMACTNARNGEADTSDNTATF